ncbi:MAG: cobalamin B12-binding domain-containing protein [Myxococcota bacterium]
MQGKPAGFAVDTAPIDAGLARTIQAEIVPRLMLAHRDGTASPGGEPAYAATPPSADEIQEFGRLLIAQDAHLGFDYIEAMRAKGLSVESVFIDLMAPTARMLGDMWLQDLCTFTDVTIGLSRLHRLLNELSSSFIKEGAGQLPGPRAALIAVPGEQHTFGLQLVRAYFQREGWDVWSVSAPDMASLCGLVREEWISLVGFSLSSADNADRVTAIIAEVRAASLNPNLFIIVGGLCVVDDPTLAQRLGADAGPVDAQQALNVAREHFEQLGSSRERH